MSAFLPPAQPGSDAMRTRRMPRCEACWLPPSLCICADLAPLSVRTRLVLLVHHVERIRSSNTGRLVARMIPDATVRVHGDPSRAPREPLPDARLLLLFPDPNARVLSAEMMEGGAPVLLVPDGTWQQARKMCRRDPDAKSAEIVRLPDGHTTRFGALRQNARVGTSSTMEAVARALGILEGAEIEARMLAAFDRFVEQSVYVRTHSARVAMDEAKRRET